MLSGIEIFNFFVSDQFKLSGEYRNDEQHYHSAVQLSFYLTQDIFSVFSSEQHPFYS